MTSGGMLLAWIEPGKDLTFVAAFVSSGARDRTPATQACATRDEARAWVKTQADEIGVPVEWI
jgi:hypothetical protein